MMADRESNPIPEILNSIGFRCGDRRSVIRENPEATVRRLTQAAIEFNLRVINDFGGSQGETRGVGLIEQSIAAAFQTFGREDIHPGDFEKAAVLLRGLSGGHALGDGSKRTGFLTAAYFLDETGHPIPQKLDVDKAEALCIDIASGRLKDLKTISKTLRKLWRCQ